METLKVLKCPVTLSGNLIQSNEISKHSLSSQNFGCNLKDQFQVKMVNKTVFK